MDALGAQLQQWLAARAGAALLQVWACRDLEDGIVLSTRDIPYYLIGDGDELCLFRYMSSKAAFSIGPCAGVVGASPAGCYAARQVGWDFRSVHRNFKMDLVRVWP